MLHWNVRKRNLGFSLVEMLATAVMVGVIAAIASPNLIGMLNRYRVQDGLTQIEGAIKEAQKQAIRNGKTCKIKLITSTTAVSGQTRVVVTRVLDTDAGETAGDPDSDFSNCLLSERVLPRDVTTTTTIAGTPTKITFSSKGNTDSNSAGIIIVSHNNTATQKCLEIEGILGNIRTGDYDGTNCNTN